MVGIILEGEENKKEIEKNKQRVLDKIKNSDNFIVVGAVIDKKEIKKISKHTTATKGILDRFMCTSGSLEEILIMLDGIQELVSRYFNKIKDNLGDDLNCNTCKDYDSCDKPYKKEK